MTDLKKNDQTPLRGAGGSTGGIGLFFIGLLMMCGGFYLLLNSITVSSHFGLAYHVFILRGFITPLDFTGFVEQHCGIGQC